MYVHITLEYHRWNGTQAVHVLRGRNTELKAGSAASAYNLIHFDSGFVGIEYIRPHMMIFCRKC